MSVMPEMPEPGIEGPRRYATAEDLTANADGLAEGDVQLPDGLWVRVRELTRAEAHRVTDLNGTLAKEREILRAGMINPKLNGEEVDRWCRRAGTAAVDKVSTAIARLSGQAPDAFKEQYKSDGQG